MWLVPLDTEFSPNCQECPPWKTHTEEMKIWVAKYRKGHFKVTLSEEWWSEEGALAPWGGLKGFIHSPQCLSVYIWMVPNCLRTVLWPEWEAKQTGTPDCWIWSCVVWDLQEQRPSIPMSERDSKVVHQTKLLCGPVPEAWAPWTPLSSKQSPISSALNIELLKEDGICQENVKFTDRLFLWKIIFQVLTFHK